MWALDISSFNLITLCFPIWNPNVDKILIAKVLLGFQISSFFLNKEIYENNERLSKYDLPKTPQ